MSFEINKLLCAALSAILVFLLASFLSELLYHVDNKKDVKLSYYIKSLDENNKTVSTKKNDVEDKKINKEEITQLVEAANLNDGEAFVKKNCMSCHDLSLPIKNKIGPSLATVLNRKVGAVEGYKYSKVLANINENWNVINLYLFLENPKLWAAGTKMSYRGIKDIKKLLNTIKFLQVNSINNEN